MHQLQLLHFTRKPVISAREMALAHPRKNGATIFGIDTKQKFHCEWAAWANGTAVRELDFHDTFLAADYQSSWRQYSTNFSCCSTNEM